MNKKEKEDQRPAWLPKLPWQPKIPTEVEEHSLRLELEQIGARLRKPGPPTEAEASSLRLEAEQIMLAQELLKSSPSHRGKNEFALKKRLREAQDSFIINLMVRHNLDSYKWPDGFSVCVLPPRDVERAGFFRSRLSFNHESNV